MNNRFLEKLICAVLIEAQESSPQGLSLTALVKFIYLADVYNAEQEGDGKIATGTEWIFYKFGPYSSALHDEITNLVKRNVILECPVEDKEFNLLQINSGFRADKLENLGLPFYVWNSLKNKIKKFSFDLKGLLDFVYFHTVPMEQVNKQGQKLQFNNCVKIPMTAYKPIKLISLSEKRKKILQDLAAKIENTYLKETNLTSVTYTPPSYDQVFFDAVSPPNPREENPNLVLNSTLSFEK